MPNTTIAVAQGMAQGTFAGPAEAFTGRDLSSFYESLPAFCRVVASLDRKRLGHHTFTTKWNWIRGVFDEQTRRKPLVFAADAVRYGI